MAREVVWADCAWQDLEQAADYIARDSPSYAGTLIRLAREAARSLREMSERGRVVPELEDSQIRELFVARYRLIYRVEADRVQILAFVHGARDFLAFWDGQ